MKKILSILIVILIFSCSTNEKNPTRLSPENMTEEELYMHYGLEAPTDVYNFIYNQLKNDTSFALVCQEQTVSNFVGVLISVHNFKITKVNIRFSDYSDTIDSLLAYSLMGKEVNFSFMEDQSPGYDFRIDVDKLCEGKGFSTTPLKDSTLTTRPDAKRIKEETREFLLDNNVPLELIE